jgi:hypothetical protein
MSNPKYAMHGMFQKGFPKVARYSDHLNKVLQKLLPELYQKLVIEND